MTFFIVLALLGLGGFLLLFVLSISFDAIDKFLGYKGANKDTGANEDNIYRF